ncbi:F-box domain containing protein [Trema orientale]|uniref:F-box domain containing protein n=1 Tax=Trema orientale TaxID=63057 RepID=A0A2P5FZH2_TREOI|nr:F-box domain containing protein [Trema orientale]
MKMKVDRISNLPDSIIEEIMSHLSIRDAVRTSILSSHWRYKWAMFSKLVFNKSSFPFPSQDGVVYMNEFATIIDHILLLHIGPIDKFELSYAARPLEQSDINRWIIHLSRTRTSIKDLVLDASTGQDYILPSCLFSCQSLTNLVLCHCMLKPPPTFHGFENLRSLKLKFVNVAQHLLENLISSCPVLESLNLVDLESSSHLNINAKNLKFFNIEGFYQGISFENTTSLAEVTISFSFDDYNRENHDRAHKNSSNLLEFFYQLSQIRRLDISYGFLKNYLGVGIEPCNLPKPGVHLHYLAVDINLDNKEDCLATLCLLSSAPNLRELQIKVDLDELEVNAVGTKTNFWEDDHFSCLFTKLQLVKIFSIGDSQPELDFIKFMLSKSPVLERMIVRPAKALGLRDELGFTKKCIRFMRASVRAEIIWLDP